MKEEKRLSDFESSELIYLLHDSAIQQLHLLVTSDEKKCLLNKLLMPSANFKIYKELPVNAMGHEYDIYSDFFRDIGVF